MIQLLKVLTIKKKETCTFEHKIQQAHKTFEIILIEAMLYSQIM